MDQEQKNFEFAKHIHEHLSNYVRSADQKAGFFLVVSGALLAWLVTASAGEPPFLTRPWLFQFSELLAIVGTGASATSLAVAVWPQQDDLRNGPIAFNGIQAMTTQADYAALLSGDPNRVVELANHSHDLARIVRIKYKRLRVAVRLLGAAGVLSAVVLLFKLFGMC